MNPTSIHEDAGSIPGPCGLRIQCCRELSVGHRCGSDPTLLWLWCGPVATVLIGPLAWEPPHTVGVALESKKKKKERESETWLLQLCCTLLFGCSGNDLVCAHFSHEKMEKAINSRPSAGHWQFGHQQG